MQEPQLVPALSRMPISAAERAPAAIASQIVLRPTPKQAQTTGPVLASPRAGLPDSNIRDWSSVSASAANNSLTTSQSPASRAGPRNRQVSIASPTNDVARYTPPPKSLYSASSEPATERSQGDQPLRSAL